MFCSHCFIFYDFLVSERQFFTKKWIINGRYPFRLKKILGHKSIKIVQEYVDMYSDDLKKVFSSFNPLEEFNERVEHIKI
ncbi:MAG TPA: hypothetical protein VJ907_07650 [Halanaerobiales bacterium]|nr:hypothetical protein [Halanaerobiales bacterium]